MIIARTDRRHDALFIAHQAGTRKGASYSLQAKSTGQAETQDPSATSRSPREVPPFHGVAPPLRGRENRPDSKQSPSSWFEFIVASRTLPWLTSGWGCRGPRFPGVGAYATAADTRSTHFAGANTIRATPMMTSAATPHSSPRGQIAECLHRHKRGVGKARPCRESNQAAIRRWVTGCEQ